jgi:hypothetical protein
MCARQAEGGAFVDPAANRMPHFPRLGPAAFQAEAGRGGAHAIPPVTGRRAARLGAAEEAGDSHRILRSCSLTLTLPLPPSAPHQPSTAPLAAKPPALHRPHVRETPLLLQYISPSSLAPRPNNYPGRSTAPYPALDPLCLAWEHAVRRTSHPPPEPGRQGPQASHHVWPMFGAVCW